MTRFGAFLAVAALSTATGGSVSAQTSGDGWWNPVVVQQRNGNVGDRVRDAVLGRTPSDRERAQRNDSRYPYDDRYDDRAQARNPKKGNGPPFCRNGQGHPVHGRQWCRDKGWDQTYGYDAWERAGWGDVILRGPSPSRSRRMEQASVADILGDVVFGRLNRLGRANGLKGDRDGRWLALPPWA